MNKFVAFIRDKGFVLALVACIVLAVGTSIWAVRGMVQRLGNEGESQSDMNVTEEPTWDIPETVIQPVEQPAEDVPVEKEDTEQPKATPTPQKTSAEGKDSADMPSAPQEAEPQQPAAAQPGPLWPVQGQVVAGYSGDELVYNETLGDWRTHNGVDIACEAGSEVVACGAGSVTAVLQDGNWGTVVEVQQEGYLCRYAGLAEASVHPGDAVQNGQTLGLLGEAGAEAAEPAHLHFEVLKGGNYVNPESYLDGQ